MLTELHNHLQETNLLPARSKLLLAVSGGVDSVTLLHLLHNLSKDYGWQMAIAHYNHGVRADATKDAILVGELADQYSYKFYLGKYEGRNHTEATLRKARYDFLEEILKDSGYDLVVTAHHNNDRLETAIFNTIRGADREGMVALKPKRGVIVRPLLPFAKAEIIIFANQQNLVYREDSTNSDITYSRNFVRNILMPYGSLNFRDFHHNLNRRLSKLAQLNPKINEGLKRLADEVIVYADKNSIEIKRAEFAKLPEMVQKHLLVFLFKKITKTATLDRAAVVKAVDFVLSSTAGKRLDLNSGLHLINSYGTVIITSDQKEFSEPEKPAFHALSSARPFVNSLFRVSAKTKQITDPASSDKAKVPSQKLYVRYRVSGDRVYPVGIKGSKKLQDVFVDAKIPRHLRGHWPIITNAKNEIVWVPNLAKDRRFVNTDADSYQYLTCEVI